MQSLVKADPVMARLVSQFGELEIPAHRYGRPRDAYGSLVRSIIGQQLSTKAAQSIYERLVREYDGVPSPQVVITADPEKLRSVGLSRAKVVYLKDLAQHVGDGRLELSKLDQLDDEKVFEELVAVKGLGQWTADMFLIFYLKRLDVLPAGDLGIRRAIERQYGLGELPRSAEVLKRGEAWRPHRSLASIYLWHSLDNQSLPA